jgi:glycosyltransferase involved in cell wall biosynthesis
MVRARMEFSIITPSFRQLAWLKRAIRSVADQGVEVEHLIQDAGTGPELDQWVREQSNAQLFVEKDRGMYDAINRGFARATGEICGYLNCDEQYLPGTLARVARAFSENPWADAVAGDYLVLDAENRLLSFRKVTPLRRAMILTDHLYAFTCAIFFRRHIWDAGLKFDAGLQSIADTHWVGQVLDRGYRFALVHEYLSAFTVTGQNRSAETISREEERAARKRLPLSWRLAAPALRAIRHVEKLVVGGYWSGPISYEVYASADAVERTRFTCERPPFRYPGA